MYFESIFKSLNKANVRYLVIGGVAVNLHGFPRTTYDLDLLIALDAGNREKFQGLMEKLRFKAKNKELAKKLMLGKYPPGKIKVVTYFRDEFEVIDVFIQSPVDFEKAYKNKETFKIKGTDIPSVAFNTLIAMKEETGRERDLIDIGYLKKFRKEAEK